MLRKAKKLVEDAEAEIASIEAQIAETEAKMAEGAYDESLITAHAALQKNLDNAMSRWELATMDLESMSAGFQSHK